MTVFITLTVVGNNVSAEAYDSQLSAEERQRSILAALQVAGVQGNVAVLSLPVKTKVEL